MCTDQSPTHPALNSPTPNPHTEGQWLPLAEGTAKDVSRRDTEAPRNCSCGCNEYYPARAGIGAQINCFVDSLPEVPVLPLVLTYEDDDAPSDDHEYVSIHVAELANLLNQVRSCVCSQSVDC